MATKEKSGQEVGPSSEEKEDSVMGISLPPNSSSYKFEIKYDGEPVRHGQMRVRDFAPSILALSALIEEANKELNQDNAQVEVLVNTDLKKGSVIAQLELIFTQTSAFFQTPAGDGLWKIVEGIGLVSVATGVVAYVDKVVVVNTIDLIKATRNRKPKDIKQDGNIVTLAFAEGDQIETSIEVAKLYTNINVRRAVSGFVRPLEREGMESMEIRSQNRLPTKIEHSEIQYFDVPLDSQQPQSEASHETEYDTLVHIIAPSFNKGDKWKVSDGSSTVWALIVDKPFSEKIDSREIKIAKGDGLKVRMRVRQWFLGPGQIKTEHEIVKVYDYVIPPKQTLLF